MFARLFLLANLLLMTVAGCGGSDLEKVVVSGRVTFDGEPIANGDIMFYPKPGTDGPVSGASIKDGKYTADGKGGVPVGEHRVEIRAFRVRETQNLPEGFAAEDLPGQRLQYLPAEFNKESRLSATVSSEKSSDPLDFNLKLP